MKAIIVSKKDLAGMNIRDKLLKLFDFKQEGDVYSYKDIKLYTVEGDSVYCENIDEDIKADIIVFATRHSGSRDEKILSAHSPGNWSKAGLGGRDTELCTAPASYLREAFLELSKKAEGIGYEAVLECTHHGPYVDVETPVMFMEIGTTEKQWKDDKAGEVLAKAIVEVLTKEIKECEAVFGIGGAHYCYNFAKLLKRTKYAVGHICPKYMTANLDKEMISKALDRTKEKVRLVLLDWKGIGPEKHEIKKMLGELGLENKKLKEIL